MNEAKAIETLSNIFHFETYTGENGNYELSSNYWNLKFDVRIREFGITIVSNFSTRCSLDIDEDETTIARELLHFIGDVICDASKTYTYEGDSGILAWPYSCNFAYIKTLKQNMDMNPGELEYQYAGRKAGLTNSSHKSVDSLMQGQERGIQAIMDEYGCSREEAIDIMNSEVTSGCHGKAKKKNKKEIKSSVDETELLERGYNGYQVTKDDDGARCVPELDLRFWAPDELVSYMNDNYPEEDDDWYDEIDSLMQGQERGIQAIMDEYGCSREEAIDIMNSEVTSGCHGKAKKKNKKEIKSSLVEEFEDSYCNASNEWPEEERHSYEDSFINGFAKDHGITYDETKKMLDELQDKWYKDADNAGIVDIYSSTRRNITNINRIFG